MVWLHCDLDEGETEIHARTVLGFAPLTFEGGYAEVDDADAAATLARKRSEITLVGDERPDGAGSDDGATHPTDQADEPAVAAPPLNPAEFSVRELREALTDGDYTDTELVAIREAEEAGEERHTALQAIDSARGTE